MLTVFLGRGDNMMIQNSYPTVPSATWQIFYKFLLFFDLLHEPLGEWKNSKLWEMSKLFIIIAANLYEIVETANVAFSLA